MKKEQCNDDIRFSEDTWRHCCVIALLFHALIFEFWFFLCSDARERGRNGKPVGHNIFGCLTALVWMLVSQHSWSESWTRDVWRFGILPNRIRLSLCLLVCSFFVSELDPAVVICPFRFLLIRASNNQFPASLAKSNTGSTRLNLKLARSGQDFSPHTEHHCARFTLLMFEHNDSHDAVTLPSIGGNLIILINHQSVRLPARGRGPEASIYNDNLLSILSSCLHLFVQTWDGKSYITPWSAGNPWWKNRFSHWNRSSQEGRGHGLT